MSISRTSRWLPGGNDLGCFNTQASSIVSKENERIHGGFLHVNYPVFGKETVRSLPTLVEYSLNFSQVREWGTALSSVLLATAQNRCIFHGTYSITYAHEMKYTRGFVLLYICMVAFAVLMVSSALSTRFLRVFFPGNAWGNHAIVPLPVKRPWTIWINDIAWADYKLYGTTM